MELTKHVEFFTKTTLRNSESRWFLLYGYITMRGSGSSVSIATDYGLDGPGSNSGADKIFRLFRWALEPIQPPIKWVPGLSQG